MKKTKMPIVITRQDYELIMEQLKYHRGKNTFNSRDAEELIKELKKAKLVNAEDIPADIVRLNSRVTIKEEKEGRLLELVVVTPDKADMKERKISIFSPIGTALIGFCKGHQINWKVPSGIKLFTILEVAPPSC